MKQSELVTIIIPVFNVLQFITESLDSVINQTYHNLEIIIIDDGSTDGSGAICDIYAIRDKRIRLIHQKNLGLSAARNIGLEYMTGKYVAFLDSDDAYHPDFIKNMYERMVSNNADIVMCRYSVSFSKETMNWDDSTIVRPSLDEGKYSRTDSLRALGDGKINTSVWNKLYRRVVWDSIRFPEGHIYEDVEVTFRVLYQSNLLFVLEYPLILHRIRRGSITAESSTESIRDRVTAYSHLETYIQEGIPLVFTPVHLNRIRRILLNQMIRLYIHERDSSDDYNKSNDQLRDQICVLGNEIGYKQWDLFKIAYIIIRWFPGLINHMYKLYTVIK